MSSLREVVVGGSACPPSLMQAFDERYGVRIVHAWGMTETSPLGTVARAAARRSRASRRGATESRRAGCPHRSPGDWSDPTGIAAAERRQVRGRAARSAGPGSPAATTGDDDPDRFHDGWLRTGDVGTLTPDGYLTLTDRAKDVIKSGGEWISSVELENTLMAHPDVVEAAVVGRPRRALGRATARRRRPRRRGRDPGRSDEAARPSCGSGSPDGSPAGRCPSAGPFVDAVPRTSVGKFDKKLIRAATPTATYARALSLGLASDRRISRAGRLVGWIGWIVPGRCVQRVGSWSRNRSSSRRREVGGGRPARSGTAGRRCAPRRCLAGRSARRSMRSSPEALPHISRRARRRAC